MNGKVKLGRAGNCLRLGLWYDLPTADGTPSLREREKAAIDLSPQQAMALSARLAQAALEMTDGEDTDRGPGGGQPPA